MTTADAFSRTYAEARGKFLAAADGIGLDVQAHAHPMLGRDGEALALDVVHDGPSDAANLLVLSSGCHGVEGFCGSGVQIALLDDQRWRQDCRAAGVAVLYLHALNPYGFSWWRRVTQENVDLNRNFIDFSQPLPVNPAYDEIHHLLLPAHWPPPPEVDQTIARYIAERGMSAWQAAVSGGQYRHPHGLFYGGCNPTWSHQALRQVLRDHARRCRRLAWIDLHTGLGPCGHGERIYAGRDDDAAIARARAWWGKTVTSIYDGSSSSARLTGLICEAAYEECAQAEYTGIALEYGTVPMPEVMNALRAEQWLENHPEAPAEQRDTIKRRIRDAFYVDADEWKQRIVDQAREAAQQALAGLAGQAG